MIRDPWWATANPNPDARARLFCFHGAGGSASAFRQWPAVLPREVEILAIRLPGHLGRFAEPPRPSVDALIGPIYEATRAHADKPYCLFGHSLGATLAYELAMRMQQGGDRHLRHLIVAAKRAPQLPRIESSLSTLAKEELIARMRLFGSTRDVFGNESLVEALLPTWRADFAAAESYEHRWGVPLNCALTALCGREDPWVSESDVRAWQALTTGAFSMHTLEGGHFFIDEIAGRRAMLNLIESMLTAM